MTSSTFSLVTKSAVLISTIFTLACTGNKDASNVSGPRADLFANRPIDIVPDLYVVTLQAPALLSIAKATPAGLEIPADAKQTVLDEQAQFEQKLNSLAPQAQIVYRYRLALNAVAVYAPPGDVAALNAISGVRSVAPVRPMARPDSEIAAGATRITSSTTSVNFIGGDKARELGFTGKGMRVGVLDTGVDYTHKMLGGSGNKADYAAIDPSQPSAMFPNNKVVGGIDLVGTDFNSASPLPKLRLPKPDANPLDEGGHGSHVAGTIAGIGDGRLTYSGVAPDASIYAVKVFGHDGSTSDAVVIAAFEYSVDPDLDLDPKDRLDVVNLSLGGGFGQPQILYTEAVRNVTRTGMVVVASAGNSGPKDYIVGAPSTSDDAISVAASIDGSLHNWQFGASRISSVNGEFLVKAVEGTVGKPIDEAGPVEGPFFFIGFADQDLTEDQKAQLAGKVALINRGKVSFQEKVKRAAEGGAIGAVVINNVPGDSAGSMGGDVRAEIPAIMVGNDSGARIQREMALGEVKIQFKTDEKIFEPELIDTITDFSSKGPRSEDNLFKPEIAAPGANVISAKMGEGDQPTRMSGTSMAAPHMSGVMALLRQAHPDLSAADLKSLVMQTSKVLRDIPLTLQGAGRVQLDKALTASLIVSPHALSLGRVQVGTSRRASHSVTLKNISANDITVNLVAQAPQGLRLSAPPQVTVAAGATATIVVESEVSMNGTESLTSELDGQILFNSGGQTVAHLAALAIATQASLIQGQTPGVDKLSLTNSSPLAGSALAFNLLGEDERKAEASTFEAWKSRSCDLQSAGYRIITKPNAGGVATEYLQVAFKLYTPMTTWVQCDVSALIDADGDGEADQELAGSNAETFGLDKFASLLIDSKKARELRLAFEAAVAGGDDTVKEDYKPSVLAVEAMSPFPQSTVAVIEAPLALVARGADGLIHLKLAAQNGAGSDAIEADDFLGRWSLGEWKSVPAAADGQAFVGLPEAVAVKGLSQETLSYTRGSGAEKLVIYYPNNELLLNGTENQSQVY